MGRSEPCDVSKGQVEGQRVQENKKSLKLRRIFFFLPNICLYGQTNEYENE